MEDKNIENIEETEVEVLDTYTDEPEEAESSKGISGKLIALGALAIGGAVVYLRATKDKRAAKREEKQIQKLEAKGYIIGKKVEEPAETKEDATEEVVPEENKQ